MKKLGELDVEDEVVVKNLAKQYRVWYSGYFQKVIFTRILSGNSFF